MKGISCLLILVFSTQIAFSQKKTDLKKLTYLKEVEWPKAYREQDTVLLDRILAKEFQMITAEGTTYTKKDELEYIKGNKPDYESFRFEITRLEIFENETAVISGKYQLIIRLKFQGGYFFDTLPSASGSQTAFAHFKKSMHSTATDLFFEGK